MVRLPMPMFRISLTNATLLSTLYLMTGTLVEVVRRIWHPHWAVRFSASLEALPAHILDFFGLFDFMRFSWMAGGLANVHVRFIYGLTTVSLIYFLGLLAAFILWPVSRFLPKPGR